MGRAASDSEGRYHPHQEYVQGLQLAERKRNELGGLLDGVPKVPPRTVHHKCQQGEAGENDGTELSVFEHSVTQGG